MRVAIIITVLLSLLIANFVVSDLCEAQTYGSGEIIYGGVRLQFNGQLLSGGTCSIITANVLQCQIKEGAQCSIQLTATRTPAGAVNIASKSLPAGWPAFSVASGWGSVSKQYSFNIPLNSAGKQYVLEFSAWSAGVVGEILIKFVVNVTGETSIPAPSSTTAPSTPPIYLPPSSTENLIPRISVYPEKMVFEEVDAGSKSEKILQIKNTGNANLLLYSIDISGIPDAKLFGLSGLLQLPYILQPSESLYINIWFAPLKIDQSYREKLLIYSNDPERRVVILPLEGKTKSVVYVEPTSPTGEIPPVPSVPLKKLCPECEFAVLTQNCQLIPPIRLFFIKLFGGTLFREERSDELSRLLSSNWAERFEIICLQEVFSFAGRDHLFKEKVIKAWIGNKDFKFQKEHWYSLKKDGVHQDIDVNLQDWNIRLMACNPSSEHDIQQLALIKQGNRYVVAGPDSSAEPRFTVDSGLMILSQFPIVAASGFTFKEQGSLIESFSNKGVLYARIQLSEEPDCYIHVFNTHMASGKTLEKTRRQQIIEAVEFIKKCTRDVNEPGKSDGHPVIFCGDFNVIGGSSEYDYLVKSLAMVDSWRSMHGDDENPGSATWVGKQPLTEEVPWGERNASAMEYGDYQRLDYIFYGIFSSVDEPQLYNIKLDSILRVPDKKPQAKYPWGGYTVSDHLGLCGSFIFSPTR